MKALMKVFFKTNRENWAPILLQSLKRSPRLAYLAEEIEKQVTSSTKEGSATQEIKKQFGKREVR